MNNRMSYNPAQLCILGHRHRSAAEYYRKAAFITTEQELKDIFGRLATEREQFADALGELKCAQGARRPSSDQPVAYMGKIWRKMKAALIVNERSRIVEKVRQTEHAALKRTRRLLRLEGVPAETTTVLQEQQQELEDSILVLSNQRKVKRTQPSRRAA